MRADRTKNTREARRRMKLKDGGSRRKKTDEDE